VDEFILISMPLPCLSVTVQHFCPSHQWLPFVRLHDWSDWECLL